MEQNIILSPQDQALAERYLAKFERRAKNFKRNRWLLLCLLILLFSHGTRELITGYRSFTDDYSVVDRLKSTEIPNGVLPEYWFVGETRKTAAMLEQQYKIHLMDIFNCLVGFLSLLCSILGAFFLLHHWSDSSRYALISRIIRAKWNEIISSQIVNKQATENQ